MIKGITDFNQWPRTKADHPIFTCSEDAIFYAHLITDKVLERTKIARLRAGVLSDLKLKRSQDNPNLQRMMDLAVKAQFYRECLEEVERIENENFDLKKGG